MALDVSVMGIFRVANSSTAAGYFRRYVVDKAHTADVDEHNYLVSPHGDHQRLRVDRSMDQTILTSTLSTEVLDRLERLRVTGPTGSVGFRVQAWGRYLTNNSLYGSVVVLYSEVGTIELDGSQMMFTDDVSEAFARAGFETEKVFRRDVDNAHRHKLRTTAAVVGLFTFLEGVDLSQASQQLNHTPANVNDPFANATAVYMRQFEFLRCESTVQRHCLRCLWDALYDFAFHVLRAQSARVG